MNWTWKDTWQLIGSLGVGMALAVLVLMITADHKVRGYYASQSNGSVPCVFADVDWTIDTVVYCTDDPQKLTDTLNKLNATVKR